MRKEDFTVEGGIAIQTSQLANWEKLLKPKVFNDLKAWATEKNHLKKNGLEVIRGSELDNYIANYFNNYTPQN